MPQLSLYLDAATMELLQEQAQKSGQSLSKCAAECIRGNTQQAGWPTWFFDLYGCAQDDDTFTRPYQGDPSLDDDPARFFS